MKTPPRRKRKMDKQMELQHISPDRNRVSSPTILEIDESSSKIPDEEKVTLEEDHSVHFLDESHHEINFLLHSHENVIDMYENNIRILRKITSAEISSSSKLELNIVGTPCRTSVSSSHTIKGENGTEDQILHVVKMVQRISKSKKKHGKRKKKKKKKKRSKRAKFISSAADCIQAVNNDWSDGTFSSETKTLKFFSGSRVKLWYYVQLVQWIVLGIFCCLGFFERPLWCASDADFNLYHGTYVVVDLYITW